MSDLILKKGDRVIKANGPIERDLFVKHYGWVEKSSTTVVKDKPKAVKEA